MPQVQKAAATDKAFYDERGVVVHNLEVVRYEPKAVAKLSVACVTRYEYGESGASHCAMMSLRQLSRSPRPLSSSVAAEIAISKSRGASGARRRAVRQDGGLEGGGEEGGRGELEVGRGDDEREQLLR